MQVLLPKVQVLLLAARTTRTCLSIIIKDLFIVNSPPEFFGLLCWRSLTNDHYRWHGCCTSIFVSYGWRASRAEVLPAYQWYRTVAPQWRGCFRGAAFNMDRWAGLFLSGLSRARSSW